MTKLLNRRRATHQFLCLALAVLLPLTPVTAIAQQQAKQPLKADAVEVINDANLPKAPQHDKTLLTDPAGAGQHKPHNLALAVPNTILFVAVRPVQVLASPVAEFYPTEVIQAAGLKAFGIDPLTTESVVFALAPTLGGPPCYSVVTQFNQPFQLKAGEATEHTVAAEVAGRKYFQSNDPMLPSICPLEKSSSLLIAPDYFLRQLLTAKEPPKVTRLAASFAAADQGDDLLAMIDVSQVRALINMGLSHAEIPPELASLKQLPNLVKLVELRVNISRPAPSSLIVTANNEADAEKVVGVFEEMKQLLAAKWTVEAQKQLASEDPIEQAAGRYSLRMSRLMDDRLQLEREGDQLILIRSDMTGQGSNPMVTTATIGVLVALLLPAVQAAREAARRNASMNNMKNILLAMFNYEAAKKTYPPYANIDAAGKPLLSWRVHLLPYMEQEALYKQFHLDEPWDSEHNKQLISLMPELFLDPSSRLSPTDGKTHYLGVLGEGRLFDGAAQGRKMATIGDGTSNSIAFVQTGDAGAVIWTKPQDWEPDADDLMKPFDPLHPGGFLAGFCDGHVAFIGYDIDPSAFEALLTVNGGETVDPGAY
jgi:type II secretory pathway pseudopilin PulG